MSARLFLTKSTAIAKTGGRRLLWVTPLAIVTTTLANLGVVPTHVGVNRVT